MTMPYLTTPHYRKMHPLMAITAVSLTIFSLLGIAAITGLITPARSDREQATQQVAMPSSATDSQKNLAEQDKSQPVPPMAAGKENTRVAATEGSKAGQYPDQYGADRKTRSAPVSSRSDTAPACLHCGQVSSIRTVKQDGEATGLGAVAGGVAGGLVGNQIGRGKGNVLMTILGAGGGAYAGNTIEKKVKSTTSYVVKVHMNDGSTRTITMADKPSFAVGDQVKVINGGISVIS